jgi:hypothetical protein
MRPSLALAFFVLTGCAHAQRWPSSVSESDRTKFQRDYYAKRLDGAPPTGGLRGMFVGSDDHRGCPGDDNGPSCVAASCATGAYDCRNFQGQLEKIAGECRGVLGSCVRETCSQGAYDCRTYQGQLDTVLGLCQGLNPDCVTVMCSFGSYDCRNAQGQLEKVAQLCQGNVSATCVKELCAFGSYNCKNNQGQLETVADLCRNSR